MAFLSEGNDVLHILHVGEGAFLKHFTSIIFLSLHWFSVDAFYYFVYFKNGTIFDIAS